MPTVKLILRLDKSKVDGTAPVWLRITANRKSRYLATGVYVEPRLWNEKKQQVRASHPIAGSLNSKLKDLYHEAGKQALEKPSANAVKVSLTGDSGSLTSYFEQFIAGLDAAGRFWDWKKYRVTLGKLQSCFGKSIDWQEIDRHALIRFERYLREESENGPNTVRKELQRVRRVFRQAIRDEVIRPEADPFIVYSRPKGERPNRRKLDLEEIRALEALDAGLDQALRTTRDAFLLAFYGGGTRFGDVCLLKRENIQGARVEYRMMKTGHRVSVPLPEPAQAIVRRQLEAGHHYLFPFLNRGDEDNPVHLRRRINSRNVVANKNLKRLAELAGINPDGLSFHVARHSFADFARRRTGDLYAISKTLGHGGLQVTQDYLRSFDRDAVDRLASQLWDNEKVQ